MSRLHDARLRRARRLFTGGVGAAVGAQVGLQVPTFYKRKRDAEIAAEMLQANWRILLKETFDLSMRGTPDEKLRPGFSVELGNTVRSSMNRFMDWYNTTTETEAAVTPRFAQELQAELKAYEAVRTEVNKVLLQQGSATRSLDADRVLPAGLGADPVAKGTFQRRLIEALALAALVALGLKLLGARAAPRAPEIHIYEV